MESVWKKETKKPKFKKLNEDIKTDVLIIGGGITGVLCGYALKNAGIDCVIIEQNKVLGGVSENTTAKITYQHGAIFDKMVRRYGTDTTAMYIKANNLALQKYKELCKNIECDFKISNSFVYSRDNWKKIEAEATALNKAGVKAEFTLNTELPFSVAGAIEVKNQAEFNPLKFGFKIAENLNIHEKTRALMLTKDGVVTDGGKIKAEKIIVATHFPFINKHGFYFLKMYQHRSYVLALKNAQKINGMYVDEADKGLSFRNYGELLLLGGGGHRTGKQGGGWQELRDFAVAKYPKYKEVSHWATQDCKTLDDIAYIGQYSKSTPNLYVATGFNKWGMTTSMVASFLLTDLISDKKNDFASVFNPSRSVLHPRLAVNAAESTIGLITPKTPRCTHLGCALKYNKKEHSWDCSCHGSRFDKNGKVINNPATEDILKL